MSRKDYYQVLGIAEDADAAKVKRAYRDLAKKFHPDRNPGDKEAERRFKEVQEAYDVLGEPEKRQRYDQLRKAGASGGFGGIDFEDLFGGGGAAGRGGAGFGGSIFDLFERAGMGRGRPAAHRGDDLSFEITVPFETAAFGGKRTLRIPRTESCSVCHGSGAAPGSKAETCPVCHGAGTAATEQGGFAFSRPCPRCFGRGKVIPKPCGACGGRGVREETREIEVKVPAGVDDGGKIRLRGEGEAGSNGAPPGDLILTVRVANHPNLKRHGLDTESEVRIDFASAALGTEREVETLNGMVTMKIPAGVQPGTRLRLKGRGIRDHRGRTGDHYVQVRVEVPRRLTAKQRELLEEFRKITTAGD